MVKVTRLHLAELTVLGEQWPVHGFVVTHGARRAARDTGVGGSDDLLTDWRVVTTAADALAGIDMNPADIDLVINTHLHFDHCGQNSVFPHAPFYVQRTEYERAKTEDARAVQLVRFHERRVRAARWRRRDRARRARRHRPRAHLRPSVGARHRGRRDDGPAHR